MDMSTDKYAISLLQFYLCLVQYKLFEDEILNNESNCHRNT